jgi:predicted NBD/HSP70 family sugar kinase
VAPSPDGVGDTLGRIFRKLEPAVKALPAPLAAVGVGIPGYMNPATGMVFHSIPLGLSGFDFNRIANPWNVPVRAENDAKCSAWAELVETDSSRPSSFISLLMEYQEENPLLGKPAGISTGIGIVIDGMVYYGSGFRSGDFKSLFWREGNLSQAGIPDSELAEVRRKSETYDAYMEEILLNLSPLISVLDPERVVLCGDAAPSLDRVKATFAGKLSGTFASLPCNASKLRVSRHREYAVALGAAGRFLVSLAQPQGLFVQREGGILDWQFLLGEFGKDAGAASG